MRLGTAFFSPDTTEGTRRHLYFVVSDPNLDTRVVIANVSTKPCPSGEVCAVGRGEHRAISQPSFLRFDKVRVVNRDHLNELLRKHLIQTTESAQAVLLKKLQDAILRSSTVSTEAQDILGALASQPASKKK